LNRRSIFRLVDDEPGVTRDRREGQGRLGDLEFTIIDTAGLDEGAKGSLTARMQEQTETAIALADALMFVIDARAGLTPTIAPLPISRRRANKPVCWSPTRAKAGTAKSARWNPTRWARRSRPDFGRAWRGLERSLRRAARADAGAGRGERRVRR